LGPYEIVAQAGAGGMGEVYRARDSRLNREVAIKILPDHLSKNPELRERFEREARAISQLSHPHICVLYDIGQHEGSDYLVLEYLEGETLGARLRRGPLATDQALRYGAQIADALDKAHRRGVVHRDLKPDNIMLTKSGAKLLDFGLAKPLATAAKNVSNSMATMTHSPLTSEGTLVGTYQYMAPEQLEGREADARSDLFAFGCVLYEMAAGKRAFDGKSTASVVASIMNSEPAPVSTVAPLTPPALEWAIRKCLAKDPEERWQSAADLASEIRWIQEGGSRAGVAVPVAARSRRKLLRWAVLAAAAVVGGLLGFYAKRPAPERVLHVAINLPEGNSVVEPIGSVISPDGQRVVMPLADAKGKSRLWVRTLSTDAAQPLDGTEGAVVPIWSPDSQFVGFFAQDGKLRKIPATGGQQETICEVWTVYGASWSRNGTIVYSGGVKGLFMVDAAGGSPVQVPVSKKTVFAYRWPSFLPDGRHFLVTSNVSPSGIYIASIDGGELQPLLPGESSPAQYAAPGYVLFLHGDSVMAQPFDARTLRISGSAERVAESVFNGYDSFSASTNGLLLYERAFKAQLTWIDAAGNKLATLGEPGYISAPYLSPDEKYVIATLTDPRQNRLKLWLYDLVHGTSTPFTLGEGDDQYPAWSPDSQQIAFTSARNGHEEIYVKPVGGGSREQLLLTIEKAGTEADRWSSDGKYMLFDYFASQANGGDVWALPLFGDRKPFPVVQTPATEIWGTFSDDGKWVAYQSDESGRGEIYVVPFPGPGGKWQISTGGGLVTYWPQGKELFYTTPDARVIGVQFETQGSNFVVGKSRELFQGRAFGSSTGLAVSRDGKRWLLAMPVDQMNASPLILETNWAAGLKN
jgi:Tol biopolymer transport system component/tRNA A-37 threonylcarbamoyl transferase component Bud32